MASHHGCYLENSTSNIPAGEWTNQLKANLDEAIEPHRRGVGTISKMSERGEPKNSEWNDSSDDNES